MKISIKTLLIPLYFCLSVSLTTPFAYGATSEKTTIGASGYPIPRFMTLANDKTYMRTGPGREYPIDWIYLKENYPLKVIAEYGNWRKVVDVDRTTGWILRSLLSLRRSAIIIKETQELVRSPEQDDRITLIAEEDVLGSLIKCEKVWCEMEIGGFNGWIKQDDIWGVLEQEEFD